MPAVETGGFLLTIPRYEKQKNMRYSAHHNNYSLSRSELVIYATCGCGNDYSFYTSPIFFKELFKVAGRRNEPACPIYIPILTCEISFKESSGRNHPIIHPLFLTSKLLSLQHCLDDWRMFT